VTFITKRGNDLFGDKSIGLLMREAITASISATRMGAQASAPFRKEIPDLHKYAKNKSYAHFSFIR
jgi:hypothetical protein